MPYTKKMVARFLWMTAFLFRHYTLALRTTLLLAIAFFMLWGALYWCTWDVIGWGGIFFVQNLCQVVFILYGMRKTGFSVAVEKLYTQVSIRQPSICALYFPKNCELLFLASSLRILVFLYRCLCNQMTWHNKFNIRWVYFKVDSQVGISSKH